MRVLLTGRFDAGEREAWAAELTRQLPGIVWLDDAAADAAPAGIEGRARHRDPRVPLAFTPEGEGRARLDFATPQRALAPGQILALHDGERLLGGGIFGP